MISLLYDCYRSYLQSNTNGENCWLSFIENLANRSNFHTELSMKKHTKKLKTYPENVFDQQFSKDLYNDTRNENEGNKLRTYRTFKDSISQEQYLSNTKSRKVRRNITKLRISAHHLKIEIGCHMRPKTILENRTCETCTNKIESKLHAITECPKYTNTRKILFLKGKDTIPNFQYLSNQDKFIYLMKVNNNIKIEFIKPVQDITSV